MKTSWKIVLTGAVVVGALGAVGGGTFATFNAQTKNPGNVFTDGSLVLSNTKQSGTACLSTAGGTTDTNVNDNCSQLFNLTVKKPGDFGSANLTIKNEGSLAASALKVFSAACANADAGSETYHGTGTPCSKIQLYIQQYSDSGFTTPSTCVYGGGTASTCDFSDTTKTLATFQGSYNTSTNGLAIGSGLAAAASGYFKVAVQLPSSADNSYQGRQATIDFTWHAEQ
jgi:predicted ribosomally synthesized peptide with SipW-like signal peptide